MKIIFMGNSTIGCPILNALSHSKHELLAVVSNVPKRFGRGTSLSYTPVGQLANELKLDFIPVDSLSNKDFQNTISQLDVDLFVVVAFRILPKSFLSLSRKGAINLHGSLLPQYRGAAPIQHALLNGDILTGISTFLIDDNLDTGPIILQKKIPIIEEDNYISLSKKMAEDGIDLIFESLDLLSSNDFIPIPQTKTKISYAPKISKKMLEIDWSRSAKQINNTVRALCYIGVFTFINGKRLKIYNSKIFDLNNNSDIPGKVDIIDNTRIIVHCGKNKLELLEIQLESKQKMQVKDWLRGAKINSGDFLG